MPKNKVQFFFFLLSGALDKHFDVYKQSTYTHTHIISIHFYIPWLECGFICRVRAHCHPQPILVRLVGLATRLWFRCTASQPEIATELSPDQVRQYQNWSRMVTKAMIQSDPLSHRHVNHCQGRGSTGLGCTRFRLFRLVLYSTINQSINRSAHMGPPHSHPRRPARGELGAQGYNPTCRLFCIDRHQDYSGDTLVLRSGEIQALVWSPNKHLVLGGHRLV